MTPMNNNNSQAARPAFNVPTTTATKPATDPKKDAPSAPASDSQQPSSIGAFGFAQANKAASGIAAPAPYASSSTSQTSSVFGPKSDSTSAAGGNSTATFDTYGSTSTNVPATAPKLASSAGGFGGDSYGFTPSAYEPGGSSYAAQPAAAASKPSGESLLKSAEAAYHQRPGSASQFRGVPATQPAAPSASLDAAKPAGSSTSSTSSSVSSTAAAGGLFGASSKVDESISGIGSFVQKPAPSGGAKPTFGVATELPKKTEEPPFSKRAEETKKETPSLAAPLKKEEPKQADVKREAPKAAAVPKKEPKEVAKKEEPKKSAATRKRPAPTELRHSTRERKQVKLENVTAPPPAAKPAAATIVPAGHGSKFADIPHVSRELAKRKSADSTLQLVHRLAYGRVGEAGKRKEDLRKFNGLAGDKLHSIAVFLNLERSGEKSAIAGRIADYLYSPKDLGTSKAPPRKAAKKKAGAAKKASGAKKAKKASPKKKKAPTKAKATSRGGKKGAAAKSQADIHDSDEDIINEVNEELSSSNAQ